jgi:small-conductance mechanosensitive channel
MDVTLVDLVNPHFWLDLLAQAETWAKAYLLDWNTLGQFVCIAVIALISRLVAPKAASGIERLAKRRGSDPILERFVAVLIPLVLPTIWLLLQSFSLAVASNQGWAHHIIQIVVSLLAAWVIIRLTSGLLRDPVWAKLIAVVAWCVAALSILSLFDETLDLLDAMALRIGGIRISLLLVIKGVISLAVLLWAATMASGIFERRIGKLSHLTPTAQVLFAKLLKIVLVTIAVVVALSSIGIDLTAFAVLGGAIGVGIGFGLQKIVSNLISGVIILLDRSIKPGDVISVGDTFGWVGALGARYTSVVTRDGMEWLIPNEDIITQQVVNWSYSSNAVRLRVPVGISYESDPRRAIALCFEAADEIERILKTPKCNVLVRGFGDSSIDLEMRVWIQDPQNGLGNLRSEVLLKVWDKFKEHNIEIPFPQRDLHLKTPKELNTVLAATDRALSNETKEQNSETQK